MRPETRKHVKFPSKTNSIKAKDKKHLKNWWEDIAEYSKAHVKRMWKKEANNGTKRTFRPYRSVRS